MNKEKKLSANTPSGFVDRYGKELALKENLIAKIEENFYQMKIGQALVYLVFKRKIIAGYHYVMI